MQLLLYSTTTFVGSNKTSGTYQTPKMVESEIRKKLGNHPVQQPHLTDTNTDAKTGYHAKVNSEN